MRVKAVYLLTSDHDDGQTMEQSAAIGRRNGIETFIYPSFNFGATTINISRDDFITWAKKSNKPVDITQALGREFLKATGKLLPELAEAATYDGGDPIQTDGGFEYVFNTPPREKHRCVRPLLRPLAVAAFMKGDTDLEAIPRCG